MALQRYSAFVALATFFLIIAGGLVTSTGSGLAVPYWPLSFGQWMPPMEGGVFYEHGHRMIAAAVGLLTVILAVWVWKSAGTGPLVRKLALASVLAVIVQGILGGVTVLLKLPVLVSVAHATLGQLFFTINVCLAAILYAPASAYDPKISRLAWTTAGFILLQLILGGIYRHSGKLLHAHMAVAVVVVVHVVLLWRRSVKNQSPILPLTWGLFVLVLIQVVLGIFSWQMPYVSVTTAHVAVGALLLAGTAVAALKA